MVGPVFSLWREEEGERRNLFPVITCFQPKDNNNVSIHKFKIIIKGGEEEEAEEAEGRRAGGADPAEGRRGGGGRGLYPNLFPVITCFQPKRQQCFPSSSVQELIIKEDEDVLLYGKPGRKTLFMNVQNTYGYRRERVWEDAKITKARDFFIAFFKYFSFIRPCWAIFRT
jgi:hypothetical protein